MVPADRILDEAQKHNVDIVGLSGLITPSLDEMVFVAQEMERRGFSVPLLIGGATTSRTHTAVKIEPAYRRGPTVYVLDASRAVGVVSNLLTETQNDFAANTRAEYVKVRESFGRGPAKPRATLKDARANRFKIDWNAYAPPKPTFLGTRTFGAFDLKELAEHIDWTPFFSSWELAGRFPQILEDEVVGEAARDLYRDALTMLDRIIAEGWFEARGVVGFWPANADGDDLVLYADETRSGEIARLHTLRQQMSKAEGRPNTALSDFVAPVGGRPTTSAPSRSPRGTASSRPPAASARPATTTRRSWRRRSPTGWRRPSPRRCTSGCGANSGAMRPTRRSRSTR
jgi:5-methyltetrahydrofolate--homocysteine methyltransferase